MSLKKISYIAFALLSLALLTQCDPLPSKDSWNKTVKLVSSGVVSIQTDVPVSFDGSWNSSGYATGFIVDSTRGIILTNRHVVTPGPVTAKAILLNNEEIDLTPLYIDPVHDFGFFKYDPSQIKHLKPYQFKFSDNKPVVGQEIRIIGNDAGQKISILDGTIARLDRDAPNYGRGRYNDFNTFYIQAATASTGGSSGSPVINIKGEVTALNAGSQSKSANAFYLPLDKVKLALEKLQAGEKIYRGTIQTTFHAKPYAELQRLGLDEQLADKYRRQFPDLSGLLVVKSIMPESSADNTLVVGDILLSINDTPIAEFSSLEQQLNDHVDKSINVALLRSGETVTAEVTVDDLDSISPQYYLKFDGGVFHDLSYQQARHFNKRLTGVYVAKPPGSFKQAGVPNRSLITQFNGIKINTLTEFNQQLESLDEGNKVELRYFTASDPNSDNYALVEINKTWFEHRICHKEAAMGVWSCTAPAKKALAPTVPTTKDDAPALTISNNPADALVNVTFSSPYAIQGRGAISYLNGTGIIVDNQKGWVVVPRSVVVSSLGDVKLIFKNRIEVRGKIEYIHPLHNLALVSYDPLATADIPVAQVKFSKQLMQPGSPIRQIGLNNDGVVEYRDTYINAIDELRLATFNVPQFIETNIDSITLVNPNLSIDGLLVNQADEMVAFWTMFKGSSGDSAETVLTGIAAEYVQEIMQLNNGKKTLRSINAELTKVLPVDALQMGLPEVWLNKLAKHNPGTDKLLAVYNAVADATDNKVLRSGDVLLAIDDVPVTSFRQVELLSQAPSVKVTFLSSGKVITKEIQTVELGGQDIDRVFSWSGLSLHAPHRAAQLQGNFGEHGVYIANQTYGSPSSRYNLDPMRRIIEVDGAVVNTSDDFVAAVKDKKHQTSVIIKTRDFKNNIKVTTLRIDNNYWPFYEVKYVNGRWEKVDYINQ